jgi:hypothetical protein
MQLKACCSIAATTDFDERGRLYLSSLVEVVAPILLAHLNHELTVLRLLDRQVHLAEVMAQCVARSARACEGAERAEPIGGQQGGGLGVAVAFNTLNMMPSVYRGRQPVGKSSYLVFLFNTRTP